MKIKKMFFIILIFYLGFLLIIGFLSSCKNAKNDDEDKYFGRAVILYNSGNYSKALLLFEKVPAKNPYYKKSLVMSGKTLFFLKRYNDAVDFLKKALKEYPDYPDALYWLGKACYFSGDYEKAKNNLAKLVEIDGYNIDALYLLGELYRKEGRYSKALDYFERIISYNDLFILSKIRRSQIFLEEGQKDKAFRELVFIKNGMPFYSEGVKTLAAELISRYGVK